MTLPGKKSHDKSGGSNPGQRGCDKNKKEEEEEKERKKKKK